MKWLRQLWNPQSSWGEIEPEAMQLLIIRAILIVCAMSVLDVLVSIALKIVKLFAGSA